jgi:hypothetical protein
MDVINCGSNQSLGAKVLLWASVLPFSSISGCGFGDDRGGRRVVPQESTKDLKGLVVISPFSRVFCVCLAGQLVPLHLSRRCLYLVCTCMFVYWMNTGTNKKLHLSYTVYWHLVVSQVSLRPRLVVKIFEKKILVTLFVVIWHNLSNHGLTRLKRFVSTFTDKLCN